MNVLGLAGGLGLATAMFFAVRVAFPIGFLVGGMTFGIVLGMLQWTVLKTPLNAWLLASMAGWSVGTVLVVPFLLKAWGLAGTSSPIWILVSPALAALPGVVAGIAHVIVLRPYLHGFNSWPAWHGVSLGIGIVVGGSLAWAPVAGSGDAAPLVLVLSIPAGVVGGSLAYGTISGIVLSRLLASQDR
jgi:hypothetical protein